MTDAAITAFHSAGGVVHFGLVSVDATLDQLTAHAAAAAAVIQLSAPTAEVRPDDLVGVPLLVEDFVGPAYDWPRRRLRSLWEMSDDGKGGSRRGDPSTGFATWGYADAFIDPPYRLRADVDKASAWFNSINRDLFGGLDGALEICSWNTEWTDALLPGMEWWGSFVWTVQRPPASAVACIWASATD